MSQATTVVVPPESLDVTVILMGRFQRPEDVPDGWFWLAPTMTRDQSRGHVQSRTLTVSCGLGTKIVEVLLSVVRINPKSCWSQLKYPRQQRIGDGVPIR